MKAIFLISCLGFVGCTYNSDGIQILDTAKVCIDGWTYHNRTRRLAVALDRHTGKPYRCSMEVK